MSTVEVYIHKSEAYKACSAEWGAKEIPVTNDLLVRLTEEERLFLASSSCSGCNGTVEIEEYNVGRLVVQPPLTTGGVAHAVKEAYQRYLDAKAKKAQEEEDFQKAALALSDEELEKKLNFTHPWFSSHLERWDTYPALSARKEEAKKRVLLKAIMEMSMESLSYYFWKNGDTFSAGVYEPIQDTLEFKVILADVTTWRANIEAEKEAKKAKEAEALKLNEEAFKAYVLEKGTENQKERYLAGRLPKHEILTLKKAEIFPDLPLYEKLTENDIECDCGHTLARFRSEEYKEALSADAWDRLQVITKAVHELCPEAKVEIREHLCWCHQEHCGGSRICKHSVLCSVVWAGETLERRFAFEVD